MMRSVDALERGHGAALFLAEGVVVHRAIVEGGPARVLVEVGHRVLHPVLVVAIRCILACVGAAALLALHKRKERRTDGKKGKKKKKKKRKKGRWVDGRVDARTSISGNMDEHLGYPTMRRWGMKTITEPQDGFHPS